MATDCSIDRAAPSWTALPLVRWSFLAVLLVAEVIALTVRFDGERLAKDASAWAQAIVLAHHLPTLSLAILTAILLFAGPRVFTQLRELSTELPRSISWLPFFGHIIAFLAFARLTALLMEGDVAAPSHPAVWAVAWFATGCATVLLWALTLLPAHAWLRLAQQTRLALLTGVAVGTVAWAAGRRADALASVLQTTTFELVHVQLRLLFPDLVCNPDEALLATSTFYVHIAPECSGYEGIGLISVFLAAYLWVCRRTLRFPRAFLLLPLGAVVIYLLNSVRIAGLVVVGSYLSPDIALGGFHSQAGWLAFNAVALGLVLIAQRLTWFTRREALPDSRSEHPSAAYLVPFLALVTATMLSTAFTSGFDLLYPLRVLVVAAALCHFRAAYRNLRAGWSWTAVLLGAAVFVLWLALEPLVTDAAAGTELAQSLTGLSPAMAALWLLFRIVGSVVTVPLAEELAFRGYLVRRLQARAFDQVPPTRFTWLSFVVSSLLFGLLHGRWLAGTLAGMVYYVALQRRGQVADAILAHAVTNALIALYVLATGSWSLWC